MAAVKSLIGLKKKYEASPGRVKVFFGHLEGLLDGFPYDVALSYAFSQVELAQNMSLYCGIVKIHRVNASLAKSAVDAHHMTRKDFRDKLKAIYGKGLPEATASKLESAEKTRDKVMHGKPCSDREKREALAHVLDYAAEVNEFLEGVAGIQPFGDLRGFKGRAQSLDKSTSRWILKGMGFFN